MSTRYVGRVVKGTGPARCKYLFLGQNPGGTELATGLAFQGPSGEELDNLLEYAGLSRATVRVDNVIQRYIPGNKDPLPEEVKGALPDLMRRIAAVNPEVIVTLGAHATHVFLPDYPLEAVHGIPFQVGNRVVIPTYHPAYALRRPSMFVALYEDFGSIQKHPRPRMPGQHATTRCLANRAPHPKRARGAILSLDTEGPPSSPWGVSWSLEPGVAGAVRANNLPGLGVVQQSVNAAEWVALHNSLWDLDVLKAMGITIPYEKIIDTMILAFNLQNLPLKLKMLALRLLNMRMKSYTQVAVPLDADKVVRPWIEKMLNEDLDAKTLKALSRCYIQDNPRAALRRSKFTKVLSPPPATLPWCREAVEYACPDADATGQLAVILLRKVTEEGLRPISVLDHGVIELVHRMQSRGLLIDEDQVAGIEKEMIAEEEHILKGLREVAWEGFNPRSPEQVEHLLFDWLEKPVVTFSKKTMRRSTDAKALAQLDGDVVEMLVELRELQKLKGSYVEALR